MIEHAGPIQSVATADLRAVAHSRWTAAGRSLAVVSAMASVYFLVLLLPSLSPHYGFYSDELRVRIEDDGPGPGGSPHRGAGTALADLRTRLNLLYGNRAALEVDSGTLGGCRVTVRLPMHAAPVAEPEGA